jgi:uncharacterized membrane protein
MANYKIIGGDGRQYGPVSADEVRQWIAEGRLNAQSLLQPEGGSEWKPLGAFAEFSGAAPGTAPPALATAPNAAGWSQQMLARPTDLRMGECLSAGFAFFTAHPGFVMGAVFLAWFLNLAMSLVPILGGILQLLLAGVVTGGLYLACLRRMRGEPVGIGSIFDGFKLCFVQLMLVGAISRLLSGIGFIFCLFPGIYLMVAWSFALPLAADKRLEFWSAMELSRKIATRVWFQLFLLLLLVFLPFIAVQSVAGLKIGGYVYGTLREVDFDLLRWANSIQQHVGALVKLSLIWALMGQGAFLICQFFAVGALMRAYENLFGDRKP